MQPSSPNKYEEEKNSLISNVPKKEIESTNPSSNKYYYLVKVIEKSLEGNETSMEQEFLFAQKDMYGNKIDARMFYDATCNECEDDSLPQPINKIIHLFLVIENSDGNKECLILASSNNGDNFENKAKEQSILVSSTHNKSLSNNESTRTMNSFLDNHYKD